MPKLRDFICRSEWDEAHSLLGKLVPKQVRTPLPSPIVPPPALTLLFPLPVQNVRRFI